MASQLPCHGRCETIGSIVYQAYPNPEYLILNDNSTDGTVDIIRKYEQHLAYCVSQLNKELYSALGAGFVPSSGKILDWPNASGLLHTNGLFVAGSVFRDLPEVEWITGRPTGLSPSGLMVLLKKLPYWSRRRFLAGANKYIQQESTYWRRILWDRTGGEKQRRWIEDATHRMRSNCTILMSPYRYKRNIREAAKFLQYDVWHRFLFFLVGLTRPLRNALGLRAKNIGRSREIV